MKKAYYIITGIIVITMIITCKKPYNPVLADGNTNVLVVDGTINSGADSTIIKLSRTVKLTDRSAQNPEVNATITVEDDQSNIYNLSEAPNGLYVSAGLNLNTARQYRLRVKAKNGEVYLSDYSPVKITPPIDSIGFNITANGLSIYANAHDATNNTRYYRWDYDETWRFNSLFNSFYVTDGTSIVPRNNKTYIHECFGNDKSTSITLATTTKLIQDVVYQAPVQLIDPGSEKISIRYSILLRQYALTKEAYEFWSNIKRNTETLGNIFDAQPSTAIGNIHCISDPGKAVIGFVSVSTVQQKRVFIDRTELPADWKTIYPERCLLDTAFYSNPRTKGNDVADRLIPIGSGAIPVESIGTKGFTAAPRFCVDCTVRGTLKQPPFWK